MEKTKVAVIGLGGIAQLVHLPNIAKLNSVDVIAVAEVNKNRLSAIADKFKIKERFTDYKELLAKSDVEAVIIATPTGTHKEIALAAIKAKKHILVEKPFTRTYLEAKPIVEAAKRNNCKIMVGLNLRYRPDAMLLKTLINAGEIGEPNYVKAGWIRRQSSDGKWFTRKTESGGGVIIDLGILLLDLCMWLMNYPPVDRVSTQSFNTKTKNVEDTSVSFIRCKNSSLINLETSWSLALEKDTFYLTVFGSKGSASINPIKIFKNIEDKIIELNPPKEESPMVLFRKSYLNELKSFIGAVRGLHPVMSSGEEALIRMKVIESMYKSSKLNAEVKV
ncbi:MAG TPA: Gfo/Idh/MocA family oxidoreductase [Ignavibacteriaceae bacterium]|nr:Gfo/Idh/MocA family oxidoreductase [Ignavibacteriaceae bacterium]